MSTQFSGEAEVPLVPASLRGYRQWFIKRDLDVHTYGTGYLEGIYSLNNTRWVGGSLDANCELRQTKVRVRESRRSALRNMITTLDPARLDTWPTVDSFVANFETYEVRHAGAVPLRTCQCGIYSLHFPGQWTFANPSDPPNYLTISGVMKGAGRTLVGQLGFRCQRAEIEALYIPTPYYATYAPILKRQAPRATVYTDQGYMYRRHPPEDLTSLFGPDVAKRMLVAKLAYYHEHPTLVPAWSP